MSPENMINAVLNDEDVSVDGFELYAAFRKGFPIENLSKLLKSESDRATSMGAFVANELGKLAAPCLQELTTLLAHKSPQIRSDAVHALRGCVTFKNIDTMGRILLLLDDPDPFVHRSVMFFILMRRGLGLHAATTKAAELAPGTGFEKVAKILPKSGRVGKLTLRRLVADEIPVVRRFAVGLACMPRLVVDAERLDIAENCRDAEGARMVNNIRERPMPMGTIVARVI